MWCKKVMMCIVEMCHNQHFMNYVSNAVGLFEHQRSQTLKYSYYFKLNGFITRENSPAPEHAPEDKLCRDIHTDTETLLCKFRSVESTLEWKFRRKILRDPEKFMNGYKITHFQEQTILGTDRQFSRCRLNQVLHFQRWFNTGTTIQIMKMISMEDMRLILLWK